MKRIPAGILEKIYERILREGAYTGHTQQLGVYTTETGNSKSALIYDADALAANPQALEGIPREKHARWVSDNIAQGMITIARPRMECDGAWEVKQSAARSQGDGKLVYGIGYALAPENTLIPDRAPDSTTPKAAAGWLRTLTSGRRSRPVKNCRTHEDPKNPHLDRIYEMEGWELGVLDDLLMKHDELVNEVLTPAQRRDFEHAMDGALEIFFMDALIRNK